MKKVVYTVILGDYTLQEPSVINNGWEYICFTDQDLTSDIWKFVKIEGGRKTSRKIKINSYKYFDYDICLYLDSKFKVKKNLNDFIDNNLNSDLCLMQHSKRNCLYDEGYFCMKFGLDTSDNILPQLNKYESENMPKNFGLFAPGIMIKRNTPEVNEFMKLWYEEVFNHSYRDQISFPYILWKNPINIDLMLFKKTYMSFRK